MNFDLYDSQLKATEELAVLELQGPAAKEGPTHPGDGSCGSAKLFTGMHRGALAPTQAPTHLSKLATIPSFKWRKAGFTIAGRKTQEHPTTPQHRSSYLALDL